MFPVEYNPLVVPGIIKYLILIVSLLALVTAYLSLILSKFTKRIIKLPLIYFLHFQAHHVLFLSHSFPWRQCSLSLWVSPAQRHSYPLGLPFAFILESPFNTLMSCVCCFSSFLGLHSFRG